MIKNQVVEILKSIYPDFEEKEAALPFDRLGVDSFDLMTLRVTLEESLRVDIPDAQWILFRSFQDIITFLDKPLPHQDASERAVQTVTKRQHNINMPQMAAGGLSENWLFKEAGDFHWMMICHALGKASHEILDDLNNRLYATFVRIRFEGTSHMKMVHENETLELTDRLSRFGKSMFFSDMDIRGDNKKYQGTLMSTFALREDNNKNLLKGEPKIPESSPVEVLPQMPRFGQEYRDMKRGLLKNLALGGETLAVNPNPLFEMEYRLNPYQDFNGVNLLYFAAYPMVHDICEREFIHRDRERYQVRGDWAMSASTIARDVFYYSNCDVNDSIVFQLNACEFLENGRVKVASTYYRKSDMKMMAQVFALKVRHG